MKTSAICLLSLLCITGCVPRYIGTRTPLQPGDAIIFKGPDAHVRANEFRHASMNDLKHVGSVVQITRPTTIVTE